MAVTCTASALESGAACFQCVPREMQRPVELYLLASINGSDTSIAGIRAMVKAAACFKCLTPEQAEFVRLYLLCQIVNK